MEDQQEFLTHRTRAQDLISRRESFVTTLSIPMYPSLHPLEPEEREEKSNDSIDIRNDMCKDNTAARLRPTTLQRPYLILIWWQELAACVLFVAAFLSLFAILYKYRDKPLPDWPHWLSINTVVSIYIVLLKMSMLLITAQGIGQLKWSWFTKDRPLTDLVKYDNASRGPFGALALLWRLRTRHLLSSFGAFIAVLTLALDPFSQQIIHYYNCSIAIAGTSVSLPRTNGFDESNTHGNNISPGAQNAYNAGIFSPGSSPSPECSTGNCTWPSEYSTLGYCSVCKDISDQISIQNTTLEEDEPFWNITTSLSGSEILLTISQGSNSPHVDYAGMSIASSFTGDFDPIDWPISEEPIDFMLGKTIPSIEQPSENCNYTNANQTWTCRGYGASRCILYACVQTYTASIQSGKLHEILLESTVNWGAGFPLNMLDTKCINSDERQALRNLNYTIKDSERWLPYNLSSPLSTYSAPNNTFPASMIIRNCVYSLRPPYMGDLARNVFVGVVASTYQDPNHTIEVLSGPQSIQSLYNFGNVTFARINETFHNISASLTNYIRQNGIANFSEPAAGVTMAEKTCIKVQWAWLAYPAILVFLTLIFFILLVVETRPTHMRPDIWKSSPLALLYHGLAQEDDSGSSINAATEVRHVEGMQALAKATTVRLDSSYSDVTHLEVQDRRPWR